MSASANRIAVELRCGRLRRLHALALLFLAVTAGWFWWGNSGAGLLGLWVWSGHWRDWRGGVRTLTVNRHELRGVRLSPLRVLCIGRCFRGSEIFADELAPAEFAAVRRLLKSWFDDSAA